jgi:hypothetical protein
MVWRSRLMLGIDPEFGASILRLWIAAGGAALLVLCCVLAFFQPQLRVAASSAGRVGFVFAAAALGAVIAWAVVDWGDGGGVERRAFEMRAQQLNAAAIAPGSPLACLDALAGDSVETACEKALFGSPASVAAASSYVAAQLTLFSSATTNAQRRDVDAEDVLAPLRRSLETDRYGFVAHVLAIRDGCTGQNCTMLALFRDAGRVRANLAANTLDRYLEHYAALWGAGSEVPVAENAQSQAAAAAPPNQPPHHVVNIDFPSAASIPAVSIMNPEPTGPVLPGVAAAAAANPNPPSTTRHARKQGASPAAATATMTVQSAAPNAVDPIWPEPMPAPPQTQAPQTASAPPPGAPVQLAPPSSNGSAARTQ